MFCFCLLPPALNGHEVSKFDEWGDLPFSDEKARLDNIAIQWQQQPTTTIYLIIFAGRVACRGEAKARGQRAKNYLVRKRHVNPKRIVWIDGGHKEKVTTNVWLVPAGIPAPSVFRDYNLKRSEVILEKGCRIKRRDAAN
jgi:hypothetical protein